MKPRRIILIRHGESEANIDLSLHATEADSRIGLTERGWEQAREAGRTLKALFGDEQVHIYVSPYRRALQTLEGMKESIQTNLYRVYQEPRLREQDFGNYQDPEHMQVIRAERTRFGHFFYRFPNGESGADVYDRVSTFLETLHRGFAKPEYPPNALIITHGLTLRLFLMRWYHWTVENFESTHNPTNCEHFVMEQDDRGRYRLLQEPRRHPPSTD